MCILHVNVMFDSMKEILAMYEQFSTDVQIKQLIHHDLESHQAKNHKDELYQCNQKIRHMLGEDLSALSLTQLEELEQQIDVGLHRIRLKKDEVLLQQIDYLRKKESILLEENQMLHNKNAMTKPMLDNMEDMETREPSSVENVDEQHSRELDHETCKDNNYYLQTLLQLGPYQPDPPTEMPTASHQHF
ncbi:hypothetical protein O6H91_13G042100 [Diphasiastrum complanatum]|uniref:Uncharacterized protein n=1 Tax=Diphasiastrum complanatum TaxID=34168 RepID=A0ACC2BUL2_DIPCM|nr:hypothetical protein O6H91_13G042100 [Diphasiastrum complanatum]